MLKLKRTLLSMIAVIMVSCCLLTSCSIINKPTGTENSETESDTNKNSGADTSGNDSNSQIKELVDFVVDVESGRDIRVLQLTDIQTVSTDSKRYPEKSSDSSSTDTFAGYKRYIGQIVKSYKPDLIIMTGDLVYGEFDDSGERFLELIEFMDSLKTPWAPVFGNHDNESNMGVDWQCDQFEESEYCLFKQRDLTGNGNYTVGLTQGGELKRVFYMLDSNGTGAMSKASLANGHGKTSAGFGEDQINWYCQSMSEVTESYPSAKLSMAFHIQLAVFADAFAKYGYDASTVQENPIDLDKNTEAKAAGDFGYIGRPLKSAWDKDYKVWNSILEHGVDSVFVGHEHCNSASVMYQGVRLTYGQKSSTYDRYNKDENGVPIMGGTYINISSSDGSISDTGICLYDWDLGYTPEINYDQTPEEMFKGNTITTFDFNGTDFDTSVSTPTINKSTAAMLSNTSGLETGFSDEVYHCKSSNFVATGIRFDNKINADKLKAIFVRMYVTSYTVESGKAPLLRVYNDTQNSILCSRDFAELGGTTDKWVYVNILDLVKNADNIIIDGVLQPFSLVYRCYGKDSANVYFDSLTIVTDGDPYMTDSDNGGEDSRPSEYCEGKKYYQYTIENAEGSANSTSGMFVPVSEENYSVKFTFNATDLANNNIKFYGYTNETASNGGVCITVSDTNITIGKATVSKSLADGADHDIEIGFINIYGKNTVYVFVKIDGETVLWELVDSYGMEAGNFVIKPQKESSGFNVTYTA